MARQDIWSKEKGSVSFALSATSPRRLRLTDHKHDDSGNAWRPWNLVTVDCQHIASVVYVAFGGTEATATLATAVYDETQTTFRIYPRTRVSFAMNATSISAISPSAATTIFIDLAKY